MPRDKRGQSSERTRPDVLGRVMLLTDLVSHQRDARSRKSSASLRRPWPPWQGYQPSRRGLRPGDYKITGTVLSPADRERGRRNPWKHWDELPTHSGGWAGDIIAGDLPHLENNLQLTGTRSSATVSRNSGRPW